MSDSPTSSAGHRPLRDRLLPSWLVSYFSRGRASSSARIASSAIASSTTAPGDDSDGPQPHSRSPVSTAATSPSASPSPDKRPGLRERLSIAKLYRRLSRVLAPSSCGSQRIPTRSAVPEVISDALQVPPSSSTDGMDPDPPPNSLPSPTATAVEENAPSGNVEEAIVHISTATIDVADAPVVDPMTMMWTEAVAEWKQKAGVDLTAPEAALFSSKEALAGYIAKMEAESQDDTEMDRWGRLRNTLLPLARIVAKLCGPIGDTLSSTVFPPSKVMFSAIGLIISATVQAHEEFELMTDAFDEIRVHLQVVEIVAAHPGTLLYKTSIELLVQVLNVLGVIMKLRHEKYPGRVLRALVEIRPLANSLQGLRRITSRYKEAIIAGTLEVVTKGKISDELERILGWLEFGSVDSSQRMSCLLNDRAEGTGLWFLDNKTFVNFFDGRTKVLSIQGKAGCGKSTIIAFASRHLRAYCASRKSTHVVLAHFFDAANNSGRGTLDSVLSSFLCQLALSDQCCANMLAKARQHSISNGCFTCHEKLNALVGMLKCRIEGFLIIDALDEASKPELPKVLRALEKIRSYTNITILVSTRVPLRDENLQHTVVSIDRVQDNSDIQTVLDIEFGDGGRLAGIANAETVRNRLMWRAGRNMRWTVLVVEQLQSYASAPHKMDKLLEELPPTLEELYANRLNATPSGDVEDVRRLLAWILYHQPLMPIEVDQLVIVLAFDYSQHMPEYRPDWLPPKPDAIVSMLLDSMFVTLHHGVVDIAHASVRDFLVALPPSSRFYISKDDAVRLMARTSLAYLLAVVKGVTPTDYDKLLVQLWHLRPRNLRDCYDATLKQDITDVLGKIRPSAAPERILSPALYTAVSQGNEELVSLLLRSGADASTPPQRIQSPLGTRVYSFAGQAPAADRYDSKAYRMREKRMYLTNTSSLLDQGTPMRRATPLAVAIKNGREAIFRLLLDNGAQIEDCEEEDWTGLHRAAQGGHVGIVSLLLERGVSITARAEQQTTPLMIAAYNSREDIVRLLLDKGAPVEDSDQYGWTALHFAAVDGHLGIVSLLLERGASVTARAIHQHTPLMIAANYGRAELICLLLDKGAHVEECNFDGETALHLVARAGHSNVASLLLQRGASIAAQTKFRSTPLTIAARYGRDDIICLLLDKGAHIEECDGDRETCLHLAVRYGHLSTVSMLLDRGSNINMLACRHSTPLHTAAYRGHVKIIDLLVKKGAALEARDKHGRTPIYLAALVGEEQPIEHLLSLGSDLRTRAKDDTTLLDAVGRRPYREGDIERDTRVRDLLMRAGCTEESGTRPFEFWWR